MSDTIYAPWTDEQVAALNEFQEAGFFHPFTCGNRGDGNHHWHGSGDLGQLVATKDGWICRDCDYTQGWAHAMMANRELIESQRAFWADLHDRAAVQDAVQTLHDGGL